jgi:hypothetical protein
MRLGRRHLRKRCNRIRRIAARFPSGSSLFWKERRPPLDALDMVVLVSSSDNGGKPCRVPITINDFLILDDVRLPGWTIGATHGAGARFIGGPLRLSVPRITAVALRVVYV